MSLENASEIDSIGIDNENDNIIMSIIDGHDWEDEQGHLLLLQDKINLYLRFIESGEIYKSYPNAKGRFIEIKIYAKYDIPESGVDFLEEASKIVNSKRYEMNWKIMEQFY
jgi:hypothetical protein